MSNRSFWLLLLLVGCGPEVTDAPLLGAHAQPIIGSPLGGDPTNSLDGVIAIRLPNDPITRTGLMVGNDLVMTSSRWVTTSMNPASITVRNGTVARNGEAHQGLAIWVNPYLPVAFIQTDVPFRHVALPAVDARAAAGMVGLAVNCYAYAGPDSFGRALQTVLRTDGAREVVTHAPGLLSTRLDDRDAGAPCFDSATNAWVGFALSSNATTSETRLFAASSIQFFIEQMTRVAGLRRQAANGGFKVTTVAPNGATMCLDVASGNPYPHADLNQYPCHGGPNQRWFYDFSAGAPMFVNAATGTCIDVPGGSVASGQKLQLYPCHGGANQRFETNATGVDHFSLQNSPGQSPRRTLCMSVRGGPSSSPSPIEQATCVVGAHQAFTFTF